jgi:HAD superfamily phosphoserine phosphatase-like hydrolase
MEKTKLAIFDIDGTIFRKNLHFELINELAWLKVFPREVRDQLTTIYTNWIEHEGTYEDYRKALVTMYDQHIVGVHEDDVKKAAKIVIPFHAKRTYVFSEKLITKLRAENYFLMVISGSPHEIVEEYNREYLHFDMALGTVYEKDVQGYYTGKETSAPVRHKGQVVQDFIKEHGFSLAESYGIGDTESDASFLQYMEHPIAFNPNQNLKALAEQEGWRIIVEKKDVIYDIAPDHHTKHTLL